MLRWSALRMSRRRTLSRRRTVSAAGRTARTSRSGTGSTELNLRRRLSSLHLVLEFLLLEDVHLAVLSANAGSRGMCERAGKVQGRRWVGSGKLNDEGISLGAHGL